MIEMVNVGKSYGGKVVAVSDVSIQAPQGDVTGLLGLNGAGKSTILSLALDLIRGSGRTEYGGQSFAGTRMARRSAVGWSLQPTPLPADISVGSFLRASLILRDLPAHHAAVVSSLPIGLSARSRIRSLSVGNRQRLVVHAALLGKPDFVLLDEPTNGVDLEGRELMLGAIRNAAAHGASVLVTSHILEDMDRMADNIVVMQGGKVVAAGRKSAFVHRWTTPTMLVDSLDNSRLMIALREKGLTVEPDDGGLILTSCDSPRLIWDVSVQPDVLVPIVRMEPVAQDLSSAFWRSIAGKQEPHNPRSVLLEPSDVA
jgi:ABC-2 type transport system ATP-binding protein